MEVQINTAELKILEDFFQDLSAINQSKIWMAAFRRSAKPMIQQSKLKAPLGRNRMIRKIPHIAGQLKRSIGTVELPQETAILMGAKLAGSPWNKGWYGGFMEGGTKERVWRKQSLKNWKNIIRRSSSAGKSTGKAPALHYFERAWEATHDQVFSSIVDSWETEIQNYIIRTNKRIKK